LSRCEGPAVSEGNGVEGGATGKYAFAVIVKQKKVLVRSSVTFRTTLFVSKESHEESYTGRDEAEMR
jgi:hypothetical protein